jgi:NADH-quinone oxidoreductase subunit J
MVDFLFYIFATLTLGSAAMVVLSRNPVNAAMFLIVSMVGVASLFVLLSAFFLAVLQVLVYAGAVVVLFLFVVMLLDEEDKRRVSPGKLNSVASVVALVLLLLGAFSIVISPDLVVPGMAEPRTLGTTEAVGANPSEYGYHLFTTYMLPFQVAGFLLLVAMIGVILVSRKYRDDSEVPARS